MTYQQGQRNMARISGAFGRWVDPIIGPVAALLPVPRRLIMWMLIMCRPMFPVGRRSGHWKSISKLRGVFKACSNFNRQTPA